MGEPPIQADLQLDWSIHTRRPYWPTSAKMFLAEGVNQAGAALCDLWENDLPGWLAHPELPPLPHAREAFDGDTPIARVHLEHGAHIRKIMPAAVYRAHFEDEVPPTIILRWELEQEEDICRAHWEAAVRLSIEHVHEREFAEKVIPDVAKFLGQLAVSGRVRTYVRPLEGGEPQIMAPALWEIDARVRIATCSVNLAHPFKSSQPPTHHIFVDEEDLQRELQAIPPERRINPNPALVGGTVEGDVNAATIHEIFQWLSGMMERPPEALHWKHEHWKKPRFIDAAVAHFGERYDESKFNSAYDRARAKYPHFSRKGAQRRNLD